MSRSAAMPGTGRARRTGGPPATATGAGRGTPGRARSSWRSPSCGPARTSRRSWSTAAAPSGRWPRWWPRRTCWACRPGGGGSWPPPSAWAGPPQGGWPGRGEKRAASLGVVGLSKSQVSAMAAELDELVEGFRSRPLDAGPYTFVWIDALTQKVREGGRTGNVHCLIASGVHAGGQREILGIDVTSSEDGAGWLAFLRGLAARGLSGAALVTSDDHAGLVNAIAAVLPGAAWQRCRTHYHRNLLTKVPKTAQPWVSTLVRTIFEQPDAESVRVQHAQVVAALEAKLPQAAAHLDQARDDILAFTAFPREVWRQIWSNNPQERLNKEVRRRTDVVGIFPGRDAIIRLVGAVLAEQNDEWTESRRYMGPEIPAPCRKAAQPDMGQNIASEAGLTIEAIPA